MYMSQSYDNVFSSEDIEYILSLNEVLTAKEKINSKNNGSVYFSITLTYSIKSALHEKLGLDLTNVESIPMRWIKGDTLPHIDKGESSFDNTYLMYLTDSQGELIIDNNSYPISKGSAYVFPESIHHETINTGNEPRLLLGPMSEKAFAVGIVSIDAAGGSTVYMKQNGSNIEYSLNDISSWNSMNWPCIINNIDIPAGIFKVEFTTNITLNTVNSYFICGTSDIQFGKSSLKTDGTRPIITIDGVTNYLGLIQNGDSSSNGYSNIYIYNLQVTTINTSTLSNSGGWIGQQYFGKASTGNYIINCTSDGTISENGGGIVGSFAGSMSGASLTIIGCSSSGTMVLTGGGIVGVTAGFSNGSVTCKSCWSTGTIGGYAGGIIGAYSPSSIISDCYSTGSIGNVGGGICGAYNRNTTVTNCYSTGQIGDNAGGIVGSNSTNITVANCYSLGNMTDSKSGGIFGINSTGYTITNCYVVGSFTGTGPGVVGYIIGNLAIIPTSCYSERISGTPGTWSSTNANTVLTGLPASVIGTAWVATVLGNPYELLNMGYTPYSIINIDTTSSPKLKRSITTSVIPGDSTDNALVGGKEYIILQITGGNASSYNTITINDSSNGIISTTTSTQSGTYNIYVRNNGSYHISKYILILNEGNGDGGGDGGGEGSNNGIEISVGDTFANFNREGTHKALRFNGTVSWNRYRSWWRRWSQINK